MTTTFDPANRPTSAGFATDLGGRPTAIPARTAMLVGSLGR